MFRWLQEKLTGSTPARVDDDIDDNLIDTGQGVTNLSNTTKCISQIHQPIVEKDIYKSTANVLNPNISPTIRLRKDNNEEETVPRYQNTPPRKQSSGKSQEIEDNIHNNFIREQQSCLVHDHIDHNEYEKFTSSVPGRQCHSQNSLLQKPFDKVAEIQSTAIESSQQCIKSHEILLHTNNFNRSNFHSQNWQSSKENNCSDTIICFSSQKQHEYSLNNFFKDDHGKLYSPQHYHTKGSIDAASENQKYTKTEVFQSNDKLLKSADTENIRPSNVCGISAIQSKLPFSGNQEIKSFQNVDLSKNKHIQVKSVPANKDFLNMFQNICIRNYNYNSRLMLICGTCESKKGSISFIRATEKIIVFHKDYLFHDTSELKRDFESGKRKTLSCLGFELDNVINFGEFCITHVGLVVFTGKKPERSNEILNSWRAQFSTSRDKTNEQKGKQQTHNSSEILTPSKAHANILPLFQKIVMKNPKHINNLFYLTGLFLGKEGSHGYIKAAEKGILFHTDYLFQNGKKSKRNIQIGIPIACYGFLLDNQVNVDNFCVTHIAVLAFSGKKPEDTEKIITSWTNTFVPPQSKLSSSGCLETKCLKNIDIYKGKNNLSSNVKTEYQEKTEIHKELSEKLHISQIKSKLFQLGSIIGFGLLKMAVSGRAKLIYHTGRFEGFVDEMGYLETFDKKIKFHKSNLYVNDTKFSGEMLNKGKTLNSYCFHLDKPRIVNGYSMTHFAVIVFDGQKPTVTDEIISYWQQNIHLGVGNRIITSSVIVSSTHNNQRTIVKQNISNIDDKKYGAILYPSKNDEKQYNETRNATIKKNVSAEGINSPTVITEKIDSNNCKISKSLINPCAKNRPKDFLNIFKEICIGSYGYNRTLTYMSGNLECIEGYIGFINSANKRIAFHTDYLIYDKQNFKKKIESGKRKTLYCYGYELDNVVSFGGCDVTHVGLLAFTGKKPEDSEDILSHWKYRFVKLRDKRKEFHNTEQPKHDVHDDKKVKILKNDLQNSCAQILQKFQSLGLFINSHFLNIAISTQQDLFRLTGALDFFFGSVGILNTGNETIMFHKENLYLSSEKYTDILPEKSIRIGKSLVSYSFPLTKTKSVGGHLVTHVGVIVFDGKKPAFVNEIISYWKENIYEFDRIEERSFSTNAPVLPDIKQVIAEGIMNLQSMAELPKTSLRGNPSLYRKTSSESANVINDMTGKVVNIMKKSILIQFNSNPINVYEATAQCSLYDIYLDGVRYGINTKEEVDEHLLFKRSIHGMVKKLDIPRNVKGSKVDYKMIVGWIGYKPDKEFLHLLKMSEGIQKENQTDISMKQILRPIGNIENDTYSKGNIDQLNSNWKISKPGYAKSSNIQTEHTVKYIDLDESSLENKDFLDNKVNYVTGMTIIKSLGLGASKTIALSPICTVLIRRNSFYINQNKVKPNKMPNNSVCFDNECDAIIAPVPVTYLYGHYITHEAILAWQGMKPKQQDISKHMPFVPKYIEDFQILKVVNESTFISLNGTINVLINRNSCYIDEEKIENNIGLSKLVLMGKKISGLILPLETTFEIKGVCVTHESVITWQGLKPNPAVCNFHLLNHENIDHIKWGNQIELNGSKSMLVSEKNMNISSIKQNTYTNYNSIDFMKIKLDVSQSKVKENVIIIENITANVVKIMKNTILIQFNNNRFEIYEALAQCSRRNIFLDGSRSNDTTKKKINSHLFSMKILHGIVKKLDNTRYVDDSEVEYEMIVGWFGLKPYCKEFLQLLKKSKSEQKQSITDRTESSGTVSSTDSSHKKAKEKKISKAESKDRKPKRNTLLSTGTISHIDPTTVLLCTHDQEYFLATRDRCFLYNVCLQAVNLTHVLVKDLVVEYEICEEDKVKGIWLPSSIISLDTQDLYYAICLWCDKYEVPHPTRSCLLESIDYEPLDLTLYAPTIDSEDETEMITV